MLQELAILPSPAHDLEPRIHNLLKKFDPQTEPVIRQFIEDLKRRRRKASTLLYQAYYLKNLIDWAQPQGLTLFHINPSLMKNYFGELHQKYPNPKKIRDHFFAFNQFYRWCIYQKLILVDPCAGITISQVRPRLIICSPEQIRKLLHFVKSPSSSPGAAFLIVLVLFFGLTTSDLITAKLNPNSSGKLEVILDAMSSKRRFFRRSQLLKLPQAPKWFHNLQVRFLNCWQLNYSKSKKTYPHPYLILAQDHLANRPLKSDTVRQRFKDATALATGVAIPIRVLRATCGHIYAQKSDPSLLAQFGWSSETAFKYTWIPRVYHSSPLSNSIET